MLHLCCSLCGDRAHRDDPRGKLRDLSIRGVLNDTGDLQRVQLACGGVHRVDEGVHRGLRQDERELRRFRGRAVCN
jgi:hypothetical protein